MQKLGNYQKRCSSNCSNLQVSLWSADLGQRSRAQYEYADLKKKLDWYNASTKAAILLAVSHVVFPSIDDAQNKTNRSINKLFLPSLIMFLAIWSALKRRRVLYINAVLCFKIWLLSEEGKIRRKKKIYRNQLTGWNRENTTQKLDRKKIYFNKDSLLIRFLLVNKYYWKWYKYVKKTINRKISNSCIVVFICVIALCLFNYL